MSVQTLVQPNAFDATAKRILWRMQGPAHVVFGSLCRRRGGYELVVGFEGNDDGIIETQFDSYNVEGLEARAEALRRVLAAKGWTPLQ